MRYFSLLRLFILSQWLLPGCMVGMNNDQKIPVNDDNNRLMMAFIHAVVAEKDAHSVKDVLDLVPGDVPYWLNEYPLTQKVIDKWNGYRRPDNPISIKVGSSIAAVFRGLKNNELEDKAVNFSDTYSNGACSAFFDKKMRYLPLAILVLAQFFYQSMYIIKDPSLLTYKELKPQALVEAMIFIENLALFSYIVYNGSKIKRYGNEPVQKLLVDAGMKLDGLVDQGMDV